MRAGEEEIEFGKLCVRLLQPVDLVYFPTKLIFDIPSPYSELIVDDKKWKFEIIHSAGGQGRERESEEANISCGQFWNMQNGTFRSNSQVFALTPAHLGQDFLEFIHRDSSSIFKHAPTLSSSQPLNLAGEKMWKLCEKVFWASKREWERVWKFEPAMNAENVEAVPIKRLSHKHVFHFKIRARILSAVNEIKPHFIGLKWRDDVPESARRKKLFWIVARKLSTGGEREGEVKSEETENHRTQGWRGRERRKNVWKEFFLSFFPEFSDRLPHQARFQYFTRF